MKKHKGFHKWLSEHTQTRCGFVTENRKQVVKNWKDVTCKKCLKYSHQRIGDKNA